VDSAEWLQRIAKLRTHRKGERRSPHKPLLMLLVLAKAENQGQNSFPFDEVQEPLTKLLRQFGPCSQTYHPEFPFWHLKSDGFWVVRDESSFQLKSGASPTKSALLRQQAHACVVQDFWELLLHQEVFRDQMVRQLLFDFWPESLHAAIRDAVGLQSALAVEMEYRIARIRKRDVAFRENVLRAYAHRCAICGFDGRIGGSLFGVEAAHVRWHAYEGLDTLSNGIALCAQHHIALDCGVITLSDGLCLRVSSDLTGGSKLEQLFYCYEGKAISRPQPGFDGITLDNIKWHRKEVFKSPERRLYMLETEISCAAEGE